MMELMNKRLNPLSELHQIHPCFHVHACFRYAREANVPIVVAINKCDKPNADPAKTRRDLMQHDIVVEDMGGDIQVVEISALYGTNIKALQVSSILYISIFTYSMF